MPRPLHSLQNTLVLVMSALWCLPFASAAEEPAACKPIVILTDDLGCAELGVRGSEDIPTLRINSIAENGVRFTDMYTMLPVCSPSSAGLLLGRYQHRS